MRIVFILLSNSRSVAVENARHPGHVRGFRSQDLGMVQFSGAGEQGMRSCDPSSIETTPTCYNTHARPGRCALIP
jgi:hypothetical protein